MRLDSATDVKLKARLMHMMAFDTSFAPVPSSYVFSMSEVGDDLGQWRGYSEGSRGYGLVFDGRALNKALSARRIHLVRCVYREREQDKLLGRALDEVLATPPAPESAPSDDFRRIADFQLFSMLVSAIAPAIKNLAFAAEREWRLVTFPGAEEEFVPEVRTGARGLMPFVKIGLADSFASALRSITVGPMPDPEREKIAIELMLRRRGLEHVAVHLSRVPFRTW